MSWCPEREAMRGTCTLKKRAHQPSGCLESDDSARGWVVGGEHVKTRKEQVDAGAGRQTGMHACSQEESKGISRHARVESCTMTHFTTHFRVYNRQGTVNMLTTVIELQP